MSMDVMGIKGRRAHRRRRARRRRSLSRRRGRVECQPFHL